MKKSVWIIFLSILALLLCLSAFAETPAVFVCDGGEGDGSSAQSPLGSFAAAVEAVKTTGGAVVVCGPYTVSSGFSAPANTAPITVTSVYDGVDFSESAGAYLALGANLGMNGTTVFENMAIVCTKNYSAILGFGNDLTLGEGLDCRRADGITTYPSVLGGATKALSDKNASLTFESGKWQRVRGGSNTGTNQNFNITFTVEGGEFFERVILASCSTGVGLSHSGNVTAKILGGTFRRGLSLTAPVGDEDTFSGDCDLTLSGGEIYADISASATGRGILNGRFYVNVENLDAVHLCEIVGAEALDGNMLSVYDGGARDLDAAQTGTISMTNPLRSSSADPWVFYYDGYYYYTATGGTRLGLLRTKNIADLSY
ncbi:MAG: hypothetical protein IJS44_06675, partial [Clostridia bacterium]|nr:hypothetical protein [Clostridia bacterium]